MILTCVHCKKQFEFEFQTYASGCTHFVSCYHCYNLNPVDKDGKARTINQSKPLQVAKKWVVRIDSGETLDDSLAFGPRETKFDTKEEAIACLARTMIKNNEMYTTAHLHQVPS